jgi:hypothetical protein
MSLTGLQAVTAAFALGNVFLPDEPIPAPDAQAALGFLDRMLGGWAQIRGTIPVVAREVFALVANQTSYSIGVGGDFNTARPPNQLSLTGASLVLTASTPPTEVPLTLFTDDQYQGITAKGLTSSQPTGLWYSPTFATGLGTIYPWPIPNVATNTLALYLEKAIAAFGDLTTAYTLPPGYDDAIIYNLWRRLAKPWGRTVDADDVQMATSTLLTVKRANVKMSDLQNDFAGAFGASGGRYNFMTGQ